MPELRILVPANPPRAWIGIVQQGVDYHNVAATRVSDYYPVAFLIQGADGALAGGIQGNIWGGWLHIRRLWVDGWLRKRGYGTLLIASAEERARDRECIGSFLSTNSYEARPLYERLGYRLYGELHDHPVAGHNRYLMRKTLDAVIPMRTVVKHAELVMNPYPSEDQIDTIRAGIIAHATAALGLPERSIRPLYCFLRSENREIVGGALGDSWGLWLHISYLWVDGPLRRRGWATRLMAVMEQEAIRRGCSGAFLDTFSFNAPQLYERLGYRVFGELQNHPIGYNYYFMLKRL
jgi:ribosomal protein S18 acetylase RimI-like enzyme